MKNKMIGRSSGLGTPKASGLSRSNNKPHLVIYFLSALFASLKGVLAGDYLIDQDFRYGAYNLANIYLDDFNIFENFIEHGCWCAMLDPTANKKILRGPTPKDELDHICREWFLARQCSGLIKEVPMSKNLKFSMIVHVIFQSH